MVEGRKWTILGFVLACLSWVIFALPLGIIAAIMGGYAYIKGDKWGLLTVICGILFGTASWIIGIWFISD